MCGIVGVVSDKDVNEKLFKGLSNLIITNQTKLANPNSIVIIVSYDLKEAKQLYEEGATYVVVPHYLGAKHITNLLARLGLSHSAFKQEREKHLNYITKKLPTY